ncbi:MAG: AAA family ATPase [Solirubrobacteraceae bacterium MAG38_C4-C5]|nr:AAA family ATPase [Candidatus Siliceabacter maunaloa]
MYCDAVRRSDEQPVDLPSTADDRFERVKELAALGALLDEAAAAGRGGVAWVEGEPGIGKSRLVEATAQRAREQGFRVLVAVADELEARRSFGVVADCLGITRHATDERRVAVARALRAEPEAEGNGLPEMGGAERELWLADQLVAVAEDACAGAPVLIALEDVQWADPPSLGFLGRLAREAPGLPLAVVATVRLSQRGPALNRLIAVTTGRGARRIALDPLDDAAAQALAGRLAGGPPGPNLWAQVAGCGGNPLFISELVRALAADGALEVSREGGAEVPHLATPPSLAGAVLSRLRFLDGETVEALELASVLGVSFSVTDLSLLSGRPAAALWRSLRPAVAEGVVAERGDRLTFRHDLVRQALYQELPAATRAGLHLDLGRALAAAGAAAGRVAEHLVRGAQPGDREAVAWLARAAREAALRGPEVAVELLQAALALADPADPARGWLVAELAFDLMAAGRREEGVELCRRALEEVLYPEGEGALRLALTHSLMVQGRLPEALGEAQRAVQSPGVSEGERAHALAWLSLGPLHARDLDEAVATAEQARAAGERSGQAVAEIMARTHLGLVAGIRGDFTEQERQIAVAAHLAQCDGTRANHAPEPDLHHSLALADLDRFDAARDAVERGRRAYQRLGMQIALVYVHYFGAYALLGSGAWDDALAEWETAALAAQDAGMGWQLEGFAARAVILTRRDELTAAEALVAEAQRQRAAGAVEWRIGWLEWARALLVEGAGRHQEAVELLWEAWERCEAAGIVQERGTFAVDLARLLATTGERERGAQVADGVRELADLNPQVASLPALAARCRALAGGEVDELVAAAEAYRAAARPYDAAVAREEAAVALARAGRRAESVAWADAALAGFERLGAVRDAARAHAALRAAGVRRGRRGPRARGQTGWEALTPSEARVAALVAEGLSNPQVADRLVISRRTVSTHVSHILAKLELRSRLELVAQVARGAT